MIENRFTIKPFPPKSVKIHTSSSCCGFTFNRRFNGGGHVFINSLQLKCTHTHTYTRTHTHTQTLTRQQRALLKFANAHASLWSMDSAHIPSLRPLLLIF